MRLLDDILECVGLECLIHILIERVLLLDAESGLVVEIGVGYDLSMLVVREFGEQPVLVVVCLIRHALPRIELEHIIVDLVLMLKFREIIKHPLEGLLGKREVLHAVLVDDGRVI